MAKWWLCENDYEDGDRVVLVRELPPQEELTIEVGDYGTIRRGFAGMCCVCFDNHPEWGLGMYKTKDGEIWAWEFVELVVLDDDG